MASLSTEILELIRSQPGLTDREITSRIRGTTSPQQPINQEARLLEGKGLLTRRARPTDGLIGNYPATPGEVVKPDESPTSSVSHDVGSRPKNHDVDALSEDEIKKVLETWLQADGWKTQIAWGTTRGIDITAQRGVENWIIEVKGPGSRQPMRVNYFLGILGETLQRMSDPQARYSIALPDLAQYRSLWARLPALAKARTQISVIFVATDEQVEWSAE